MKKLIGLFAILMVMVISVPLYAGMFDSFSQEGKAKNSFKEIAKSEYKKRQQWAAENNRDLGMKSEIGGYTYDIQKTTSTVRPYVGIIRIERRGVNMLDGRSTEETIVITYEYENGKWKHIRNTTE